MRQTVLHKELTGGALLLQDFAATEESILAVLAYFDVFYYPLTREEIQQFRENKGNENQLDAALAALIRRGIVFCFENLYSLQNNPLLAYRRREGNQRAGQLIHRAIKVGRFLQQFPFIRAVGISGSLSKNYADAKADFDFFIITKARRLWIARTLMHLYKKLTFLRGRQHYYCMNYYIDEEVLLLEDQNIFTAIELKTLLPVSGEHTLQRMFGVNHWIDHWLPFCKFRKQEQADRPNSVLKRLFEWFFNNKRGDRLDDHLMRISTRRWKDKEQKGRKNNKGQLMMLISGKHHARFNPGAFQEKVLELYEQKLKKLNAAYSIPAPVYFF